MGLGRLLNSGLAFARGNDFIFQNYDNKLTPKYWSIYGLNTF